MVCLWLFVQIMPYCRSRVHPECVGTVPNDNQWNCRDSNVNRLMECFNSLIISQSPENHFHVLNLIPWFFIEAKYLRFICDGSTVSSRLLLARSLQSPSRYATWTRDTRAQNIGCCDDHYTIVARIISHCSMMIIRDFETSVSQLSETSNILRIDRMSSENEPKRIRGNNRIIRRKNLQNSLGKSNQIREHALL